MLCYVMYVVQCSDKIIIMKKNGSYRYVFDCEVWINLVSMYSVSNGRC